MFYLSLIKWKEFQNNTGFGRSLIAIPKYSILCLSCTSYFYIEHFFKYFSLDIGIDIQDDMGRHEVGLVENTDKLPVNEGKGCLFTTSFQINKVT